MMDAAHSAAFDKHVRGYIFVFVTLMVLTLVTVAVWRLHLPVPVAIALALAIATVKGSLVACYFMHLISEKKLILSVMLLTIGLFVVLLLVPVLTVADRIGR
jgi:cytochrome c oxidase subunit 4